MEQYRSSRNRYASCCFREGRKKIVVEVAVSSIFRSAYCTSSRSVMVFIANPRDHSLCCAGNGDSGSQYEGMNGSTCIASHRFLSILGYPRPDFGHSPRVITKLPGIQDREFESVGFEFLVSFIDRLFPSSCENGDRIGCLVEGLLIGMPVGCR